MSVYIKGFPLPNNCGACPLRLAWCRERIYMVTRPERCPLVPVPPHGRLIDADALGHDLDYDIENDQRVLDEMDFVGKERERVQFDKDCKQNCMWYLSNAPTIIPAEGK